MDADLAEVMIACTDGYLDSIDVFSKPGSSVTVVAAAAGYPGPYVRGDTISFDSDGKWPAFRFDSSLKDFTCTR